MSFSNAKRAKKWCIIAKTNWYANCLSPTYHSLWRWHCILATSCKSHVVSCCKSIEDNLNRKQNAIRFECVAFGVCFGENLLKKYSATKIQLNCKFQFSWNRKSKVFRKTEVNKKKEIFSFSTVNYEIGLKKITSISAIKRNKKKSF